jgi:2-dehydropantoate 2-reductase
MQFKQITILGPGAVGLYYGGMLQKSGAAVTLLSRSNQPVLNEKGIHIEATHGNYEIPVRVVQDPEAVGHSDLILVCLKTTGIEYQDLVLPKLISPSTYVMTLQNGLGNEEQLAKWVSPEYIIGAVVFVCLNRVSPGRVQHTAFGHMKGNSFSDACDSAVMPAIQKLFKNASVDFFIEPSMQALKWEKLIWNVPFNGLSASLGGMDTQRILSDPKTVALVEHLMKEVVKGAKAMQINLDPALILENIKKTKTMGPYETSMCIDYHMGRALEIESIIGLPYRQATGRGAHLPFMGKLYADLNLYNESLT